VTRGRNKVSECSRRNSAAASRSLPFGCLLSLSLFLQIFGHDDGYQDARPVRDGVPKNDQVGSSGGPAVEGDQ